MKKNIELFIVLIAVALPFCSCKKETAAAPVQQKNYTAVISDKTWWGTLTNAGETAQYFSVHFNADNTLSWSQLSDDYAGRWTVDNKKLTLTFTNPAVVITGEITDDNKLTNITSSTANKVNTAELLAEPNMPLEGSVWLGTRIAQVGKPTDVMQLTFLPGDKVEIKINNVFYAAPSHFYSRPASGGCFRIKYLKYFGVILSPGEMKGCELTYDRPWQARKQ